MGYWWTWDDRGMFISSLINENVTLEYDKRDMGHEEDKFSHSH